MEERTYQTRCGTIHYWVSVSNPDTITLVFLPGLTADHRLFDKQIQYFESRYNVIVWDAPAHGSSIKPSLQRTISKRLSALFMPAHLGGGAA